MPTLTKLLKKSVKVAKNGERPTATQPVDMPEGARIDKLGDWVLPGTPAACADLLFRTTKMRLDVQHRAERLEKLETALEEHFINTLPTSNATGIAGQVARVQIKPNPIPQVSDWAKFYAYVLKHKAFELLQRRLSKEAINERLDAKERIPGVTIFNAKKVSCTKI